MMKLAIQFLWCGLLPVAIVQGLGAQTSGCVVDPQILSLPACAFEHRGGQLYVSSTYLPMFFGPNATALGSPKLGTKHLAYFAEPGHGWTYFDGSGRVVVRNVATMDNGPSAFYYGLVRVARDHKWGLADYQGRIIVPLTYDGMLDYEAGKGWLACTGCHVETGPEGEYSWFRGGRWVWLDRRGNESHAASEPR